MATKNQVQEDCYSVTVTVHKKERNQYDSDDWKLNSRWYAIREIGIARFNSKEAAYGFASTFTDIGRLFVTLVPEATPLVYVESEEQISRA